MKSNKHMDSTGQYLQILPLKKLENLFSQKCLLPAVIFPPEVAPGAWTKCIVDAVGEVSAICQIYPRDDIQCCYLDDCVTTFEFQPENNILTQLVLLDEVESASEVDLIFTLTEQVLCKKQLTYEKLVQLAKYMLQPLMLVENCCVQNDHLRQLGVSSIKIVKVNYCTNGDCFMISERTKLNIVDVRTPPITTVNLDHFENFGFEQALQDLNDLLQLALNDKRPKGFPLNALVVGASGSGKTALITEFIRVAECNCFTLTAAKVLGQYAGETEAALRLNFEAALWFSKVLKPSLPIIILIEDLHLLCPAIKHNAPDSNAMRISAQLLALIDELHAGNSNIICLATTNSPETLALEARRAGRFEREIILSIPTEAQRKSLLAAFFKQQLLEVELDEALLVAVAQQTQGYIAADLALLVRSIAQKTLFEPERTISEIVQQALQEAQPSSIRSTDVCVYKPLVGFEAIGGMEKLKRTLQVAILAGLQNETAFRRFGLSLPKGVLLYGPPGCAKTMIAKCLAKEANMTFIATSGAEVYSPYVGCAERFIAKLFDTARKNAPCLIFLDEIDALVGRRSLGSTGGDVQLRILSTLLTEMDGIVGSTVGAKQHILVVAATNRPDMIDDALLRPGRFDKLIHVPAPDIESRIAMLQLYAQRMPFANNVDLLHIANNTINYSGADLCNICNEAALQALQRDFDAKEIEAEDFAVVLSKQKSSLSQKEINWYHEFETKFVR